MELSPDDPIDAGSTIGESRDDVAPGTAGASSHAGLATRSRDIAVSWRPTGRMLEVRRYGISRVYTVKASGARTVATSVDGRFVLSIEHESGPKTNERLWAIHDLKAVDAEHVICRLVDSFEASGSTFRLRAIPSRAVPYSIWARWNEGRPVSLRRVAYGLALALSALHERGLYARYLPPLSVCVDDGAPLLCDFPALVRGGYMVGAVGSAPYAAPETVRGNHRACEKSDVWCIGALLVDAILVSSEEYAEGQSASHDYDASLWIERACEAVEGWPDIVYVVRNCTALISIRRCTVDRILTHMVHT